MGYFSVDRKGFRLQDGKPARFMEELARDVRPSMTSGEVYRSLGDYDPVLRSHCRFDERERFGRLAIGLSRDR